MSDTVDDEASLGPTEHETATIIQLLPVVMTQTKDIVTWIETISQRTGIASAKVSIVIAELVNTALGTERIPPSAHYRQPASRRTVE